MCVQLSRNIHNTYNVSYLDINVYTISNGNTTQVHKARVNVEVDIILLYTSAQT